MRDTRAILRECHFNDQKATLTEDQLYYKAAEAFNIPMFIMVATQFEGFNPIIISFISTHYIIDLMNEIGENSELKKDPDPDFSKSLIENVCKYRIHAVSPFIAETNIFPLGIPELISSYCEYLP